MCLYRGRKWNILFNRWNPLVHAELLSSLQQHSSLLCSGSGSKCLLVKLKGYFSLFLFPKTKKFKSRLFILFV